MHRVRPVGDVERAAHHDARGQRAGGATEQAGIDVEQAAGTLDIGNLQDVNRQLTVDVNSVGASTGTGAATPPPQ